MNETREPGARKLLSAPWIVCHLASSTSLYRADIQDAHDLIESATAEHPELMGTYGELLDNLQIALDASEMGSLAMIQAACCRLLG
jgi:hypothetical protein